MDGKCLSLVSSKSLDLVMYLVYNLHSVLQCLHTILIKKIKMYFVVDKI